MALSYMPENPLPELTLYIIHTLLHLKGYDDQNESDIAIMRAKEQEILAFLEEKNLVLSNTLVSIK
jgi:probable rRNA maturation factor